MISLRKIKIYVTVALNKLTGHRLDKILNYRFEKKKFFQAKGYPLNFKNPRSFSEKVVWKKLHDRNPLLPITADKYMVRFYVKEVLGEKMAEEILVPLLYVTGKPETIPFDQLPDKYIVKPNHGSGMYMIIDGCKPDPDKIINTCLEWLEQPYGLKNNEWAYQKIKPKILIEELLKNEKGNIPEDYKFYVFGGKCRFLYVLVDRCGGGKPKNSVYSPDWERIKVRYYRDMGPDIEKPSTLGRMLSIAEKLAEPFDFVRVDLYTMKDKIYFGELTHYPMTGRAVIDPVDYDFKFGRYWEVKPFYWKERIKPFFDFIKKAKNVG